MLRGKGKAQPRRASRHRGRADRDDQKAVFAQEIGGQERGGGVADDDRNDRALRLR